MNMCNQFGLRDGNFVGIRYGVTFWLIVRRKRLHNKHPKTDEKISLNPYSIFNRIESECN
ncbi:MAG: hypothetical protein ACI8XB_000040 [Patiriisocius sp.]|jgi:hypothetical protein